MVGCGLIPGEGGDTELNKAEQTTTNLRVLLSGFTL